MKAPPPLATGLGIGLLLLLLLAPATGNALGKLAAARAERVRLAALVDGPQPGAAALVVPGLAAGDDIALLVSRVRDRAHTAGVLVEEIKAGRAGGALIHLHLAFSGSEKAIVALADTLERDTVLLRFAQWRIVPIQGGVRLTADAIAVRR